MDRERTKQFALRIIKLYLALPSRGLTEVRNSDSKSGNYVGAHYREAQRAKSNPDFISKIALQELEETIYWLELLSDSGVVGPKRLEGLRQESEELLSILVTIARKVKNRPKVKKSYS